MNDERRKKLSRAQELLNEAHSLIEDVQNDEQDAFDNLPESLQQGDKGSKMEEAIGELETAAGCISDAVSNIDTATAS